MRPIGNSTVAPRVTRSVTLNAQSEHNSRLGARPSVRRKSRTFIALKPELPNRARREPPGDGQPLSVRQSLVGQVEIINEADRQVGCRTHRSN